MTFNKKYRCLYNHEMLICFTTQTPYQSYKENVKKGQFTGYVEELINTQVDALMCCPTAWRLPIYYSKVNPVWQTWAREHKDLLPEEDWKYFDKVFSRVKRYMLSEDYEDPLQITLDTAQKNNLAFFFSYRMNDVHQAFFTGDRISPTMDPIWRDHPEWRMEMDEKSHPGYAGHYAMNYLHQEVREWYYAIINELVENYDIDGFELDFMRNPIFSPPGKIKECTELMTAFVKKIHTLLYKKSIERNKQLKLCVRVPRTLELCTEVGLDVSRWCREKMIDMLNVSSSYMITPELAIEEFKQICSAIPVYGEMYHLTFPKEGESNRRSTKEVYETTAYSFWDRGADGVSFFNFCYVRDHHFSEARRRPYMNPEPPFKVLQNICNLSYLKDCSKHYIITPGFGTLPVGVKSMPPFKLYIADDKVSERFHGAMLRLEFNKSGFLYNALKVFINDFELFQMPGSGELFHPFSNEALPVPDVLFYFKVPLNILKHAWNRIEIKTNLEGEFFKLSLQGHQVRGIELALYQTTKE